MIGYVDEVSSLTNLRIGPEGYKAKLTVKVGKVVASGLWFYNIWSDQKKGYSGGDGGTIRVTLKVKGVDLVSMLYRPKGTPFLAKLMFGKAIAFEGEVTILWENVDASPEVNWASINAMQMVKGAGGSDLQMYWKGDRPQGCLLSVSDKLVIWDFLDGNGSLLDVGYNYYEVWSKEPKALDMVRQVVNGKLLSFRGVRVLVQGDIGNSCCIVEGDFGTRVGVVDGDDDCLDNGKEGHFGTWLKYTFNGFVGLSGSSPWTVRFLCDSSPIVPVPTVWPIRKGVLSFGYAECANGKGKWAGWSYWGKENLKLATLPISFF